MILKYISLIFIFGNIICLFDEEIKMDKPIKGSALFFRAYYSKIFFDGFYLITGDYLNQFYMISNSITNYIFNIKNGQIFNFTGIIPLESTIYEPFVLSPFYIIDAHSSNNFVQIYVLLLK